MLVSFDTLELSLWFNRRLRRELVVLHTTVSMFGKFSVQAWSPCGGLNEVNFCICALGGRTHFGMHFLASRNDFSPH